MDYLNREFRTYARRSGRQSFGDCFPLKLQTFTSFITDVRGRLPAFSLRRTLEVGSGSGIASALLAQTGSFAAALDLETTSCLYTLAVAAEYQSRVLTVRADGVTLPFADGAFTFAFSFGLIEHFEPLIAQAFVRELIRVSSFAIAIGVPNERPSSAFSQFRRTSNDYDLALVHRPVECDRYLTREGLRLLFTTGLSVFVTRSEANGEFDWLNFHQTLLGGQPPHAYSIDDISRLVDAEHRLTDDERLQRGFIDYAVGIKP